MIKTRHDLKKFREKLGKTQLDFAEILGYSYSYYVKIERGRLEFYKGIKDAANAYEKRLESYKKGCDAYNKCEDMCNCHKIEAESQKMIKNISAVFMAAIFICLVVLFSILRS